MAAYPLQPSLQIVDPLQRLYSQPASSQAVVEALQLYSTLQHSTALQLYSALHYTSSTIPLRVLQGRHEHAGAPHPPRKGTQRVGGRAPRTQSWSWLLLLAGRAVVGVFCGFGLFGSGVRGLQRLKPREASGVGGKPGDRSGRNTLPPPKFGYRPRRLLVGGAGAWSPRLV